VLANEIELVYVVTLELNLFCCNATYFPLKTLNFHSSEAFMGKPYKLLIIDDSEEILSALSNYFTKKKYDVFSASNGLDGLKLLDEEGQNFDLVITDLVLPNISGVAVISIVKNRFPNMPVIAITGWGEHPEALAKEAHADLVMEKPFKLPDLEKAARELLERNQADAQP
jgi:DNA-binding response OmpR family regulator